MVRPVSSYILDILRHGHADIAPNSGGWVPYPTLLQVINKSMNDAFGTMWNWHEIEAHAARSIHELGPCVVQVIGYPKEVRMTEDPRHHLTASQQYRVDIMEPWLIRATYGHSMPIVCPQRMHVALSRPFTDHIESWTLVVGASALPDMMRDGIRPSNQVDVMGMETDKNALHFYPETAASGKSSTLLGIPWVELDSSCAVIEIDSAKVSHLLQSDHNLLITNLSLIHI